MLNEGVGDSRVEKGAVTVETVTARISQPLGEVRP